MESLQPVLERVWVVLVEPRYDGNLGQVARAMRNFGLSRLALVGGRANPRSEEAIWYAREEGEPVLLGAQRFATLREAVATCRTVIGTSRRLGRNRGPCRTPDETWAATRPWERDWETAIVFGREAHGLFTEELDLCGELLWIPSDPGCPSLNLSHAVTVIGYSLANATRAALGSSPAMEEPERATAEDLEAMYQHVRRVWARIGYLHFQNPDAILRRWRKIFGRAKLTPYDVSIVRALAHQIDWVAKVAKIPEGGPREAPPGFFDKHRDFGEEPEDE